MQIAASTNSLSIVLPNDEATTRLGAVLAGLLKPGQTVLLEGPIGAGKTHLARALIRHRLEQAIAEVPSPTFTLVVGAAIQKRLPLFSSSM